MKRGPLSRRKRAVADPRWRLFGLLAPVALGVLLAFPTFHFTYLFDDYDFLGRAQLFRPAHLLPDPSIIFYRPISREIYFGALYLLDPNQPLWGHLGNALFFALSVGLLTAFVKRLAGERAGYFAGIAFASLWVFPILVGWVSGAQDLLAIVFVLAALHLQLSGRSTLAVMAAACAMLSKETAVAFVPAMALVRCLAGRPPYRVWPNVAWFGTLLIAWAGIHPGIRLLLANRLESGASSSAFLTVANADLWGSLSKGVATLGNVPIGGPGSSWPADLEGILIAALILILAGVWGVTRHPVSRGEGLPVMFGRTLSLALLLIIPPLLLVSALVRNWQPYYVGLAAIGTSMLIGVSLARAPVPLATAGMLGFMALGVWCRGMDLGPDIPTERNVRPPMEHIRRVENEFHRLWPWLDTPTRVSLSVYTPEDREISTHLFRFQALRIWYRDHSIDAMRPEWRRPGSALERLGWVGHDLSVHEIDTRTLEVRSSNGAIDSAEYVATLRSYALGLAATGKTERAVQVLLDAPPLDEFASVYNRRLAAALLLADEKLVEAAALIKETPQFEPADAIEVVSEVLTQRSRADIDRPLLAGMGIAASDTASARAVMRSLALRGNRDATARFARRLLEAAPGDWEAMALLRWLHQGEAFKRVTVPVVADSLW